MISIWIFTEHKLLADNSFYFAILFHSYSVFIFQPDGEESMQILDLLLYSSHCTLKKRQNNWEHKLIFHHDFDYIYDASAATSDFRWIPFLRTVFFFSRCLQLDSDWVWTSDKATWRILQTGLCSKYAG